MAPVTSPVRFVKWRLLVLAANTLTPLLVCLYPATTSEDAAATVTGVGGTETVQPY